MTKPERVLPLADSPTSAQPKIETPPPADAPQGDEASADSDAAAAPIAGDAATAAKAASRDELIRAAAYRRFQERGGEPGYELQDWLEAEAEVDGKRGESTA